MVRFPLHISVSPSRIILPQLPYNACMSIRGGSSMLDHDDSHRDDPLAVIRGITYGIGIGVILWAMMIGVLFYLLK